MAEVWAYTFLSIAALVQASSKVPAEKDGRLPGRNEPQIACTLRGLRRVDRGVAAVAGDDVAREAGSVRLRSGIGGGPLLFQVDPELLTLLI
jgi:hypothetical protein